MAMKHEDDPQMAESFEFPDRCPKERVIVELDEAFCTADQTGLSRYAKFFFEARVKDSDGANSKVPLGECALSCVIVKNALKLTIAPTIAHLPMYPYERGRAVTPMRSLSPSISASSTCLPWGASLKLKRVASVSLWIISRCASAASRRAPEQCSCKLDAVIQYKVRGFS